MNLETINNVSDLLSQNQEPQQENQDVIMEAIKDCNPDANDLMKVTLRLLGIMGGYHNSVIQDMLETGEVENLKVWIQDEHTIHTIWNLLSEVDSH